MACVACEKDWKAAVPRPPTLWMPGTFHDLPDALVIKYMDEYKTGLRCRMEARETAVDMGSGVIKTIKGPAGKERLVRMKYPCGLTYDFQGPRGRRGARSRSRPRRRTMRARS